MAKYKPQSPAVIERNRLRRAKQHKRRMARQLTRVQVMKIARGAARRLARKDIARWKTLRKARLQQQSGSIQGKAPTLTRVMATIEREIEG